MATATILIIDDQAPARNILLVRRAVGEVALRRLECIEFHLVLGGDAVEVFDEQRRIVVVAGVDGSADGKVVGVLFTEGLTALAPVS